jgi:hypothetical protein
MMLEVLFEQRATAVHLNSQITPWLFLFQEASPSNSHWPIGWRQFYPEENRSS